MSWQNRSLIYLCRSFDQLNHGQEYDAVQPVIHIGVLDYTLFEKSPEFYATYKLINVKNDEVKKYQIDYWAKLFKATTWEEIHMLASENDARAGKNTIGRFGLISISLPKKILLSQVWLMKFHI